MSIIGEYIKKRLSANQLEGELLDLIKRYNLLQNTTLFVYASAFTKNIPDVPMNMDDYFIIGDMIKSLKGNNLHFYVESPGGSGETAEEIVRCLRKKFTDVSFVISGEAKSAATILTLSGDEILMTDSGSLGPIDAQVKVGRGVSSAHDYMEWIKDKQNEAFEKGKLNPFDATMVAQISPGELNGIYHALNFAQDLIIEWLPKYKFKNWNKTETNGKIVTEDDKKNRATEIATALVDHSKWRSHGRSLKINDLEELLKIYRIDDNPKLADLVYRIQTVIKLLFQSTSTYKIFATADEKIFKQAQPQSIQQLPIPQKHAEKVEIVVKCSKCMKDYQVYGKFINNPKIDADMKSHGKISIIKNDFIKCSCGFQIDLMGIRNDIENKVGKKLV